MEKWHFFLDGLNYSRYLVLLKVFLSSIDMSHPELLEKGGIAVAWSLIPGALSAFDRTMEETFMKFAVSHSSLVGLFFYQRWTSTRLF